jgi:hypothetical protein
MDLNDMELALEHATKANADIQKTLHTTQDQARDVQMQVEEEIRMKNEVRMSVHIKLQSNM